MLLKQGCSKVQTAYFERTGLMWGSNSLFARAIATRRGSIDLMLQEIGNALILLRASSIYGATDAQFSWAGVADPYPTSYSGR